MPLSQSRCPSPNGVFFLKSFCSEIGFFLFGEINESFGSYVSIKGIIISYICVNYRKETRGLGMQHAVSQTSEVSCYRIGFVKTWKKGQY